MLVLLRILQWTTTKTGGQKNRFFDDNFLFRRARFFWPPQYDAWLRMYFTGFYWSVGMVIRHVGVLILMGHVLPWWCLVLYVDGDDCVVLMC
jgi:hypothetical protein